MSRRTNQEMQAHDDALIADAIKLRFFPLTIESGEGARMQDTDGREYLDFAAGWALANLGYSHPIYKQYMTE